MVPGTGERVPRSTSTEINRQIEAVIAESLQRHAEHPEVIDRRLRELDDEWDVERTPQANASVLAFVGVALGALLDRWWLVIPAIVTAFLFQHAIQGWCPPLPILRRLGFRTAREIDMERAGLKAIRGDFARLNGAQDKAAAALQAART